MESYSVRLLIIPVAEKNSAKGQGAELMQLPCQVCFLTQQVLQTPRAPLILSCLPSQDYSAQALLCVESPVVSAMGSAYEKDCVVRKQTLTGIPLFVLGTPKDKDFEREDGTLPNLN